MSNKPAIKYKKRSFSQYQKTQRVSEAKQRYFRMLPMMLVALEVFVSLIFILLTQSFPEATGFFFLLWLLATTVLVSGFLYGKWVKKRLFGALLKKRELSQLYSTMNPLDFEHFVAEKFRRAGYTNVVVTPGLGDGGIDIVMEKDATRYAVQCKKYHPESFVKIDELRAFVYAYRKASADEGIYVTTANYSAVARQEMKEEGVRLIDGAQLLQEWKDGVPAL